MDNNEYNQQLINSGMLRGVDLTKLAKHWQNDHFLKVDGKCGTKTLKSILEDDDLVDIVSDTDTEPTRQLWEPFHGPLDQIPRNRREVYQVFGNPSNGSKVDRKWKKENIRTFRKGMALPGVPPHRYIKIHKLAEPYMREALRRAAERSDYKIVTFAAFNFRLMRGRNRLSYHSWGIAMDINHVQNPAIRYKSAADKPVPFSEEWHKLRPRAMDKAFVDAIKSVGWRWGGDWKTFADDQHFEFVA